MRPTARSNADSRRRHRGRDRRSSRPSSTGSPTTRSSTASSCSTAASTTSFQVGDDASETIEIDVDAAGHVRIVDVAKARRRTDWSLARATRPRATAPSRRHGSTRHSAWRCTGDAPTANSDRHAVNNGWNVDSAFTARRVGENARPRRRANDGLTGSITGGGGLNADSVPTTWRSPAPPGSVALPTRRRPACDLGDRGPAAERRDQHDRRRDQDGLDRPCRPRCAAEPVRAHHQQPQRRGREPVRVGEPDPRHRHGRGDDEASPARRSCRRPAPRCSRRRTRPRRAFSPCCADLVGGSAAG